MDSADQVYVMGRNPQETERLRAQALFYDPSTRDLLEQAGVTRDMHVLDLGCGPGDVSLILGEMVGPAGRVVGIDSDSLVLDIARERARTAGYAHVQFVEDNLEKPKLDGDFDAIVGRLILVHLRDPVAVVRAFTQRLRGPRLAVFQDIDWSIGPISRPRSPLLAQVWRWIPDVFRRAGLNPEIGTQLREVLLGAGFASPKMRIDAPAGGGSDFGGYEYIASGLRSNLPLLLQFGIARPEEIDIETFAARLRREIVEQNGMMALPAFVGAWANR
jgi:SAM-dependent methyltransferase